MGRGGILQGLAWREEEEAGGGEEGRGWRRWIAVAAVNKSGSSSTTSWR